MVYTTSILQSAVSFVALPQETIPTSSHETDLKLRKNKITCILYFSNTDE